jgi:hypothetical protein
MAHNQTSLISIRQTPILKLILSFLYRGAYRLREVEGRERFRSLFGFVNSSLPEREERERQPLPSQRQLRCRLS